MFRPIGNKVLIEPDLSKDKTEGGIVLPSVAQNVPNSGKVLACNSTEINIGFTLNDRVLYKPYATAIKVEIDGKELLILEKEDILGVL